MYSIIILIRSESKLRISNLFAKFKFGNFFANVRYRMLINLIGCDFIEYSLIEFKILNFKKGELTISLPSRKTSRDHFLFLYVWPAFYYNSPWINC